MKVCNDLVKKIIAEEVEGFLNEEATDPRRHIDGLEDGADSQSLINFIFAEESLFKNLSLTDPEAAPNKALGELHEVIVNLSRLIIQNPLGSSVADKLTLDAAKAAAWSGVYKSVNKRLQEALKALYKRSLAIAKELEIAEKAGLEARGDKVDWQDKEDKAPTQGRNHKVVKGDTLWDLSRKYLGDPRRWMEIWDATAALHNNRRMYTTSKSRYSGPKRGNRYPDPTKLQIGTVLTIPAQ